MQGLVVLPDDVQIVPLSELPPSVRTQVDGEDGDFALTRPLSRTPSKVIGSNAAALLQQFRDPKTIVAGILAYSKSAKARPSDVLEEAYPLIESCLLARLLETSEDLGLVLHIKLEILFGLEQVAPTNEDRHLATFGLASAATG